MKERRGGEVWIRVESNVSWAFREPNEVFKEDYKTCVDIKEAVERHVDDVSSVMIETREDYVCSHCGYAWTEDGPDFNGGCCEEDMKNAPVISEE